MEIPPSHNAGCWFQTPPWSLPITSCAICWASLLLIGTKNSGWWLKNVDNMLRLFPILLIFLPEMGSTWIISATPGLFNKTSVKKLFTRLRFHTESVLLQFCMPFQDQTALCRRVPRHKLSYHVSQTQPLPACASLCNYNTELFLSSNFTMILLHLAVKSWK